MKYNHYEVEDFVEDDYFQSWVLDSNAMTDKFWNNWLESNPNKKEVVKSAFRLVKLLNSDFKELPFQDFDNMWQNIVQRKSKRKYTSFLSKTFYARFSKIAVVFVIGLVITYSVYQFNKEETIDEGAMVASSGVTLELEDGTVKLLDNKSLDIITNEKGDAVVTKNKNRLLYNQQEEGDSKILVYNTLSVPYGEKFELVFSDGSHVFLNSGSKLKYPVTFLKDKARGVYLEGEAYFTIEKDSKRPFTVYANDMNVKVYGTQFNVSNYKNERNTSVVLAEGSVSVQKSEQNKKENAVLLKPWQRAVYENQNIVVNEVNVDKYIAWTKGQLYFVDTPFELIIKELERHFNVVINNDFIELNNKKFTGTFEHESLNDILKICQQHTYFKFYTENKKVVITEQQINTN